MRVLLSSFLVVLISTLLISCGGGGGGGGDSTPTVLTGAFIDGPVSGLTYTTATRSGVTNALGEFEYLKNEVVTFSLGGITLGQATGAALITPVNLVAQASDPSHPYVINILRLLQTLDEDSNSSNGITLSATVSNAVVDSTINPRVPVASFETDADVIALIQSTTSQTTLIDSTLAQQNFQSDLATFEGRVVYKIAGSISGLSGSVSLSSDSGETLTLSTNGSFSFVNLIDAAATYNISITAQPAGQTCNIQNAQGTANADVNNINISCSNNTYTVSATVNGLTVSTTLVLLNNAGDATTVTADGSFTFANPVNELDGYNVTVQSQPLSQMCSVSNSSAIPVTQNVSNVVINCVEKTYAISVTVNGLASGNVAQNLVLQNNAADNLIITQNAGATFSQPVISAQGYNVSILNQRSGQTCVVSNASAASVTQDINTVSINCADNTYSVSATISGLLAGNSLSLLNNAGDSTTLTSDGSFTFASAVSELTGYAVTVQAEPAQQTCTVSNGSAPLITQNISNVSIICTEKTYSVSVAVNGLASGNVAQDLVLLNNSTESLTVTQNANLSFTLRVTNSQSYNVTVQSQRSGQTCSVVNGSSASITQDVTLQVNCADNTYSVAGNVSGLTNGNSVVLLNKATDATTVTTDGGFAFTSAVSELGGYVVTVQTQPAGQTCTVSNASAATITQNISNVTVNCVVNTYTVGGTITGLATGESSVLLNNGADSLTINADGVFVFVTPVEELTGYAVTVTPPAGKTCLLSNASASTITQNINNVSITCGTPVVDMVFDECTTPLPNGENTSTCNPGAFKRCVTDHLTNNGLSLAEQVTSLNCPFYGIDDPRDVAKFTNLESMDIGDNPLNQVVSPVFTTLSKLQYVNVAPNKRFPPIVIDVVVIGLQDSDIGALNNSLRVNSQMLGDITSSLDVINTDTVGVKNIQIQGNGLSGSGGYMWGYIIDLSINNLQVPGLNCDFDSNSDQFLGRLLDDNPSRFKTTNISCQYAYQIGGTISGLSGSLTLQNNLSDDLVVTADGAFSFVTPVVSGNTYDITILNQPANQTCSILDSSGFAYEDVTNIKINCWSTAAFNVDNTAFTGRTGHSSSVLDGKIYIIGGFDNTGNFTSNVEVYDPVANSLSLVAALPSQRAIHSSAVLDGKIYVIGGIDNAFNRLATVDVYDPATNLWSSGVSLPAVRRDHTSVSLNGKIYVIAGRSDTSAYTSDMLAYDPLTTSWTSVSSLTNVRRESASVVVGGKIYVTGGISNSGVLSSVEIYDPVLNSWSPGVSLLTARYNHSAHTLNEKIYVTGGYDGFTESLSSVEIYDETNVTNSQMYLGNVSLDTIYDHTSEAINGRYYLIGGDKAVDFNDFSIVTGIRSYNPLNDLFSPLNAPAVFSNAPNLRIPDNAITPIETTISISGTGQLVASSLVIDIELRHTYQGDLTIDLISPTGTKVRLWNLTGAGTDNIIGSFPTTLTASGDMSILNAEALDGVWTLIIQDSASLDTGSLISWGIRP